MTWEYLHLHSNLQSPTPLLQSSTHLRIKKNIEVTSLLNASTKRVENINVLIFLAAKSMTKI